MGSGMWDLGQGTSKYSSGIQDLLFYFTEDGIKVSVEYTPL